MPEGPEVYIMTRRLARKIRGAHLQNIESLHDRYSDGGKNEIPPAFVAALPLQVTKVSGRGKKTFIKFENDHAILCSYGMSGHWQSNLSKYAQLDFTFNDGNGDFHYYWVSARSLPTCVVQFMSHAELDAELAKLGIDIIRDTPDDDIIIGTFKGAKNICAWLMDQSHFCGIGNYIKSCALYRSKVSPHRKVSDLTDSEKWLLWTNACAVAQEAIAANGMSARDFKDESGERTGVTFDITPYSCKVDGLGNKVTAETIAGRTTFWCPAVQQ